MNVVFVARQSAKTPLLEDRDERASSNECGFFNCSRCGDDEDWLDGT